MTTQLKQKWINRFTPLYSSPTSKTKVNGIDIPEKTLVKTTGQVSDDREEIVYRIVSGVYTGWVHTHDIEDYVRNLPVNVVNPSNKTEDETDFEQYIILNKIKQTNMCGQMCIADVTGIRFDDIISKWQSKEPTLWKRIFGTGKARGTGQEELQEILAIFDRPSIILPKALYQEHIKRTRYTIKGINNLLKTGSIIASVHISQSTGLIQPTGILHWVRIKTLIPERNGQGTMFFYNPAMDCIEVCSYAEFIKSSGIPYGAYIPNLSGEQGDSK